VTSEDSSYFGLIVGLPVAFGVLLIIIIIAVIICVAKACRKHHTWSRQDATAFTNDGAGSTQNMPGPDNGPSEAMPVAGAEGRDPPNYAEEFPFPSLEKSAKC